jgi:predicted nucleotidyltransferase
MTRISLFLCCALLAGCQTIPTSWAPTPPPAPHTILLFEETPPKCDAIKQTVLRHIPPGTPIEQAQAILEQHEFTCRPYSKPSFFLATSDPPVPRGIYVPNDVHKRLFQERERQPVYCQATLHEVEEWHLQSYTVLVVLIRDDANRLRDVEVGVSFQKRHENFAFFQLRPDLHEPLGLPIEAARARMTAAGFRCSELEADRAGPDPRPHVHCEAFNEWLLGGQIVRVHLYPDEAGVIRESKVLEKASLFDPERSMWLHGDESTAEALAKGALYPVRLGVRYTLITAVVTIGVTMAVTAMPYGLH